MDNNRVKDQGQQSWRRKLLTLAAGMLAVAGVASFGAGAFTGPQKASQRIGMATSQGANSRQLKELAARSKSPERAWMLSPRVFNRLSSGGQRAALHLNGVLPMVEQMHQQMAVPAQPTHSQPNAVLAPGVNIRVNDPGIDSGGQTQSESCVAANGTNIVVGFNDSGAVNDNSFSGYAFSTDGGSSFSHVHLTSSSGAFNLGDPVIAFGPAGEVYYATLSDTSDNRSIVALAKSVNGGANFSDIVDVSTSLGNTNDLQDKEWLAVDKSATSAFKGNVYVAWTDFTSRGTFVAMARSTNGGASFEAPINVSNNADTFVQGTMLMTAPNGDLYLAYTDFGSASDGLMEEDEGGNGEAGPPGGPGHLLGLVGDPPGIKIVKSTDGGKTFSTPKLAVTFNPLGGFTTGGDSVRTRSFPSLAVDSKENIHLAFPAISDGSGTDRGDVFYARSTDAGNTFSVPVKLNDDNSTTEQFLPSVAVTADGSVGVRWWDRRNDPVNNSLTDVYMAISKDSGATFSKNFRVTDHNWVFSNTDGTVNTGYHGDYDQVGADGSNFYLSWADERNGQPDAYFTVIPSTHNASAPDFNISSPKLYDAVLAGQSASFDLSTAGFNGFSGMMTLTASPDTLGISYSFSSAAITPGQPAKLNVTTASNTLSDTYLITVTATSGSMTRKTNLRLTVYNAARTATIPGNVSNTNGFSNSGGAVVDSKGVIHAIYEDDTATPNTGQDVFYKRSQDGGKTYSAPVKISTNQLGAFSSTIAIDNAGKLYIVYTLEDPNTFVATLYLVTSTDGGNTFSTPKAITPATVDGDTAVLAFDSKNNLLVTFFSFDFNQFFFRLFATRSTNGGASFSTPVQVTGDNEPVSLSGPSAIAFDAKGGAYIAYRFIDPNAGVGGLRLIFSKNGGTKFKKPVTLATDVNSSSQFSDFRNPSIVVDSKGAIEIAYGRRLFTRTSFQINVELIKSTNKGKTFGSPVAVSAPQSFSNIPFLLLDRSGNLNVVFEGFGGSSTDVFAARSTDGGATFASPVNVSGNSGASTGVRAVATSNSLVLSWTDDSTANTEMFVSTLPLQ